MNVRLYIYSVLALAALTFAGCKRETRHFDGGAPSPNAANQVRMSPLQPGLDQPPPPMKNPIEQNAYDLAQGKQLFSQMNCVGCHAHGGGDIGPPLMDAKWIYGSEPENIYATILEGRPNGMPSFRGRLTNQQIWQLVGYVRSMSGQVPHATAPSRNDEMQSSPPENSANKEKPVSSSMPKSGEMPQ